MAFIDKMANNRVGFPGKHFRGDLILPGSMLFGLTLLPHSQNPKANLRVEASIEDDGARRNRVLGFLMTAVLPHQPGFRLLSRGKKN